MPIWNAMTAANLSHLAQKTAVRFGKTGPAVYHSHHDMIRFWERAVKRADLPMRLTQGFNPRPRMIFPHALGVGIASHCEEVELELHTSVALADLLARLRRACGDTLDIMDAVALPPVKKSRTILASGYAVSGWPAGIAGVAETAAAILALPAIEVERGAPGDKRRIDIRPHIAVVRWNEADQTLRIELRHSQAGSARPDEIVRLAGEMLGIDWRDLRIEKTGMLLE